GATTQGWSRRRPVEVALDTRSASNVNGSVPGRYLVLCKERRKDFGGSAEDVADLSQLGEAFDVGDGGRIDRHRDVAGAEIALQSRIARSVRRAQHLLDVVVLLEHDDLVTALKYELGCHVIASTPCFGIDARHLKHCGARILAPTSATLS